MHPDRKEHIRRPLAAKHPRQVPFRIREPAPRLFSIAANWFLREFHGVILLVPASWAAALPATTEGRAMRLMRKRRLGAFVISIAFGGSLLAGAAAASPASASVGTIPGSTATPTTLIYGTNWDYQTAALFRNANVDPLLQQLDPETLRWPGGTEADFFNWRKGEPTRKPKPYVFTLADLYHAYKATGAAPIFDLNVLSAANRTSTTNQMSMLERARSLGLPIKYVEIGNELYGGGRHGTFAQAFPNGKAYGKTVAIYVRALHQRFPGVRVAADALLDPSTSRDPQWNSQLLATATGAGAPDALILHDYPGVTYDPFTQADVGPLFHNAYAGISGLTSAVNSLGGKPVWLTEYNFRGPYVPAKKRQPNPVASSYAHELYEAEFALMLPRIQHLALADNFTAVGGGDTFASWMDPAHPELTPGGQAVEMIDAAAQGATGSTPITVPGAPTLPGGGAAVTGQAFTRTGGATTAVLVNLTGSAQNVPVGADISDGTPYRQAVGVPTAQQAAAGPLTNHTVSGNYLQLPAYSIVLVNTIAG
jgi:hypothetical protein